MKIEWDKTYEKKKKTTVYADELEAIDKVISGEHESVKFTYEYKELVRNASYMLQRMQREYKLPVKVMKRGNSIYVFKEDAK